ncbi:hypothetical protein RHS02_09534, partial [Rhizoctonia solani]
MRTTEGVWHSCTPTENYLLVSLNFEVVHSIERSAEDDALIVLFNTAISNLVGIHIQLQPVSANSQQVLFRNNFAMSRDIAGLFMSFQSFATVLDPNVNRGLFNSTLAIIIKDVINADSKNIVRGRLHQRLDQQLFVHGGGGAFLHNLKTLMGKIKTSDWGSMNQNVAAHRAQQLIERSPNALSFGRHEEGPLKHKNMDADAELKTPEFATGNDTESEALAEQSLRALFQACGQMIHTRHQVPDTMFIESL